ncbi:MULTISPECIES: hypothetical protein [Rhizobium]|uniref:hypothetical protein n=1 Tax=Rhizobium TaxID=379 RepID=UPI0014049F33|nr:MULTISPECIES: hypothetical protein [Rhizobium]
MIEGIRRDTENLEVSGLRTATRFECSAYSICSADDSEGTAEETFPNGLAVGGHCLSRFGFIIDASYMMRCSILHK